MNRENGKLEAAKSRFSGAAMQEPVAEPLAQKLRFSKDELDCYGSDRFTFLSEVLEANNDVEQAVVCDKICTMIGRPPFEGAPRNFLQAFRAHLQRFVVTAND